MESWALLVLAGVIAGTIAGTLGAGGAVFLIAALAFGVGLPMQIAGGIALVNAVGISGSASITHGRRQQVDVRTGVTVGAASVIGGGLGGWLSAYASERMLTVVYLVLLLVGLASLAVPTDKDPSSKARSILPIAVIGVFTGLAGGFVGLGGAGFILLPLLVRFTTLRTHVAVGTCLFAGLFGGIAALVGKLSAAHVPLLEAAVVLVGSVLGTVLGTRLGAHLSPVVLRRAFAAGLTVVALRVAADLVGLLPRG
ncbi:MAG: sulfite exporter TauE/SafE family protein [Chloroflexi bacterium]|nr:sulfite exporter TauE/SafE family protein [Chloroflexota bacterium]